MLNIPAILDSLLSRYTSNSVLLKRDIPNVILSPNVAWYSSKTPLGTIDNLKKSIGYFVCGRLEDIVVQGYDWRSEDLYSLSLEINTTYNS